MIITMSEGNTNQTAIQCLHYTELSAEQLEELARVARAAFDEYKADDIDYMHITVTGETPKKSMAGSDQTAFIYTREGRVVGFCRGAIITDENGKWLYAAGMAVLPECRRQGIGYKLMQYQEDWAKKQGAAYARVGMSNRAPKPKAFHHRCGYKDWYYFHLAGRSYIQIYMRKDFGEPYPAASA